MIQKTSKRSGNVLEFETNIIARTIVAVEIVLRFTARAVIAVIKSRKS